MEHNGNNAGEEADPAGEERWPARRRGAPHDKRFAVKLIIKLVTNDTTRDWIVQAGCCLLEYLQGL